MKPNVASLIVVAVTFGLFLGIGLILPANRRARMAQQTLNHAMTAPTSPSSGGGFVADDSEAEIDDSFDLLADLDEPEHNNPLDPRRNTSEGLGYVPTLRDFVPVNPAVRHREDPDA